MASLGIEEWSAKDVAQWVKGLGSQYEPYSESFAEEEITGKVLLTINAEYLAELSIENVSDQNALLDAVHCLLEVDTCLRGETVHGQVEVVNEQTKSLIKQLKKEGEEADEGDVNTSDSSVKNAGQVYQLAKKLLSWLIRSPFSEMNACWPLKESVCRVVRDMTDESLLKNREHLEENLEKLQASFDSFLNEKPMHEVFKQPPVLTNEKFTLEGEGLGIGVTTSHHIHTVNSVALESPAGKNGNIKNGDEIVKVNEQCVIAWPQKNVISLMKSNPNTVSLTLKKLPPVKGPLNKPVDKPGTPLSEMNVIMDHSKVAAERPTRIEIKQDGIKEETSLEMQAIENENAAEEISKMEGKIEGISEETEVQNPEKLGEVAQDRGEPKDVVEKTDKQDVVEDKNAEIVSEENKGTEVETSKVEKSVKVGEAENAEECAKKENVIVENDAAVESEEKVEDTKNTQVIEVGVGEKVAQAVEKLAESEEVSEGEKKTEMKEEVNEMREDKTEKMEEGKKIMEEKVVNGEAAVEMKKPSVEEPVKEKIQTGGSEPRVDIKVEAPGTDSNGPNVEKIEEPAKKSPDMGRISPSKRPNRAELPRMNIGSVKNVTVGGTSAKQVEVYGSSQVKRREKKIDGAPNKRISCIDLGEADCEGWLTKKSGGHGLTPTRWRRQWCVLKEEHLYYYKTSFDREAGGVIDITGYKMSAAPEVKKPYAFKCEKEGAKKYFFHAEDEVSREMWIKNLNSVSRGERKQNETGGGQAHEAAERKSSLTLKAPAPNRPRTASVLAGIKFNYYDDEDYDDSLKQTHEPSGASTAQRVNEGLLNGQKDDAISGQNILKIAAGVEDAGTCEVIPVGEIQGDKETQVKAVETQGDKESDVGNKGADDQAPGEEKGETPVDEDKSKNAVGTSEVVSAPGLSEETSVIAEDLKTAEKGDQEHGNEEAKGASEQESTSDVNNGSNVTQSEASVEAEVSVESSGKTESTSVQEKGSVDDKLEGGDDSKVLVGANEDNKETKKSEILEENSDGKTDNADPSPTPQPNGDVGTIDEGKTEHESEAGSSADKAGTDEFQRVVDTIKEAEISIDGTEKSPQALFRKLSVNSQSEIMNKVVKLRVLRQNLKDKEHSMDAIEELLSSDVTPETISEWRTKYESLVSSNSIDVNDNSQQ